MQRNEMELNHQAVMDVNTMPTTMKSEALWNIQVQVSGSSSILRLVSLNHPIDVAMSPKKTDAHVRISKDLDRTLVPNRDFVLLFQDDNAF
jgi:hypothetical protein